MDGTTSSLCFCYIYKLCDDENNHVSQLCGATTFSVPLTSWRLSGLHSSIQFNTDSWSPFDISLISFVEQKQNRNIELLQRATWGAASKLNPHPPKRSSADTWPHVLGWVLLLGLVDIGAAFSQVEVHFISGVAALQLQQGCVLTLVPQATLVASEDGLTPQSGRDRQELSAES